MILLATLDNLSDEIYRLVNEYSQEIKNKLEQELDQTADKIIEYIKQHAPRSGSRYALADSFIKKGEGEGVNKLITIYSKEKGRIVHLLEFGFKHRNGQFVSPRPFMRPSFDKLTPEMLQNIKRIIESGG